MQTIPYTTARNDLARLMKSAMSDREPITVTRNGNSAVVIVAAEEYAAMEATLHLLSTPANAERIRQGLKDFRARKTKPGALCD